MKRFVKLATVFAVLILALACFVACSSGDDSSSTSTDDSSSTGSTAVLEGLWVIDDDDEKNGYYFKGNTLYPSCYADKKYYYIEDYKESFFVSGNKIVVYYDEGIDELPFTIRGNTMTLIMSGESFTLKKVDRIPAKITSSEFDNML